MKEITVSVSDEFFDIFKEVANKKNISIGKVIENYFCLDVEIPEFRIAKCDYKIITIMQNIIKEFKQIKEFLNNSDIKNKQVQYKIINCIISSAEGMLESILEKINEGTGLELNTKYKKTNENYTEIINSIHELCLNDRSSMIKFLNLMVKEFKDIKLIRFG